MARRIQARPTSKTIHCAMVTLEKTAIAIEKLSVTIISTTDEKEIKFLRTKLDPLLQIQHQALKILKEDNDAVKNFQQIKLLAIQEKIDKHLLDIKKKVSDATNKKVVVNISLEDDDGEE